MSNLVSLGQVKEYNKRVIEENELRRVLKELKDCVRTTESALSHCESPIRQKRVRNALNMLKNAKHLLEKEVSELHQK